MSTKNSGLPMLGDTASSGSVVKEVNSLKAQKIYINEINLKQKTVQIQDIRVMQGTSGGKLFSELVSDVAALQSSKQATLTAGTGISISGTTISSTAITGSDLTQRLNSYYTKTQTDSAISASTTPLGTRVSALESTVSDLAPDTTLSPSSNKSIANSTVYSALQQKQGNLSVNGTAVDLSVDSYPNTGNTTHLVSSAGVATALSGKASLNQLNAKANTSDIPTIDQTPTENATTHVVSSGGLYTYIPNAVASGIQSAINTSSVHLGNTGSAKTDSLTFKNTTVVGSDGLIPQASVKNLTSDLSALNASISTVNQSISYPVASVTITGSSSKNATQTIADRTVTAVTFNIADATWDGTKYNVKIPVRFMNIAAPSATGRMRDFVVIVKSNVRQYKDTYAEIQGMNQGCDYGFAMYFLVEGNPPTFVSDDPMVFTAQIEDEESIYYFTEISTGRFVVSRRVISTVTQEA